jgi:hypothetical protein
MEKSEMSRIFGRLFRLPFHLVLLGVLLGLTARLIYPPKTEVIAPRQFSGPLEKSAQDKVVEEEEFTDLPIE